MEDCLRADEAPMGETVQRIPEDPMRDITVIVDRTIVILIADGAIAVYEPMESVY